MSGIARTAKNLFDKQRVMLGLKDKPKKNGPIRKLSADEVGAVEQNMGAPEGSMQRRRRRGGFKGLPLGGAKEGL